MNKGEKRRRESCKSDDSQPQKSARLAKLKHFKSSNFLTSFPYSYNFNFFFKMNLINTDS